MSLAFLLEIRSLTIYSYLPFQLVMVVPSFVPLSISPNFPSGSSKAGYPSYVSQSPFTIACDSL